MLLHGFQLEILVNGTPLEEYTLPINESRVNQLLLDFVSLLKVLTYF